MCIIKISVNHLVDMIKKYIKIELLFCIASNTVIALPTIATAIVVALPTIATAIVGRAIALQD